MVNSRSHWSVQTQVFNGHELPVMIQQWWSKEKLQIPFWWIFTFQEVSINYAMDSFYVWISFTIAWLWTNHDNQIVATCRSTHVLKSGSIHSTKLGCKIQRCTTRTAHKYKLSHSGCHKPSEVSSSQWRYVQGFGDYLFCKNNEKQPYFTFKCAAWHGW